jgi:hypothetical protein
VHGAHGHYYILNGEIATHPSSAQVLGDRRREAVALKRQEDTTGWQKNNDPCAVSSGSVISTRMQASDEYKGAPVVSGRVARPFGSALTDPGRRLSRTRLFPEVTRIGPLWASRDE